MKKNRNYSRAENRQKPPKGSPFNGKFLFSPGLLDFFVDEFLKKSINVASNGFNSIRVAWTKSGISDSCYVFLFHVSKCNKKTRNETKLNLFLSAVWFNFLSLSLALFALLVPVYLLNWTNRQTASACHGSEKSTMNYDSDWSNANAICRISTRNSLFSMKFKPNICSCFFPFKFSFVFKKKAIVFLLFCCKPFYLSHHSILILFPRPHQLFSTNETIIAKICPSATD